MMTFAQINAAIQAEMQLDPGLVSDAERLRFINDGLSTIGSLQILEKVTTTPTISQYPTKPVDLLRLRGLYLEDVALVPANGSFDTDTTGTPHAYIIEGDDVRLYPVPSASVSLRWEYTYSPVAGASITSSAIPDLPDGWDGLLVDYACYRAHRKNGNYLSSSQYRKDFDMTMGNKMREQISLMNSSKHVSGSSSRPMSADRFIPPDNLF